MGCPAHKLDPTYCHREPEQTALYQAVAGHLETFLAACEADGHTLPAHVESELRRYLDGAASGGAGGPWMGLVAVAASEGGSAAAGVLPC